MYAIRSYYGHSPYALALTFSVVIAAVVRNTGVGIFSQATQSFFTFQYGSQTDQQTPLASTGELISYNFV